MSAPAPVPFNLNRVTDHLLVGGGLVGPDELAALVAGGVTHVVSAAVELDDEALCVPDGVAFLHIRWGDDGQAKPAEDFRAALGFVARAIADGVAGGRLPGVYVHCAAGVNRGPLLACFVLAALGGVGIDTAWQQIVSVRPQVRGLDVPNYRASAKAALDDLARLAPALSAPVLNAQPDPAPASPSPSGRSAKQAAAASAPQQIGVGDGGSANTNG